MGKIRYNASDGYYFTSDNGIRYSIYEGMTVNDEETTKTSDIGFIVLDGYEGENIRGYYVGFCYGVSLLTDQDKNPSSSFYDYESSVNKVVEIYEKNHPAIINAICKGTHFADDEEKMVDFFQLTKEEFLNSYSYLNEKDYIETAKEVAKRIRR